MTLTRQITLPIVVGAASVLGLTAYFANGIGVNEFGHAVRTVNGRAIPWFAELFKMYYPATRVIFYAGVVVGGLLLAKRETSACLVAWYAAVCLVLAVLTACLTVLAFYLLSTTFRM